VKSLIPLSLSLVAVVSCQSRGEAPPAFDSTMPALENRADSLAFRSLEASGGEKAFRGLPYLQFYFGSESPLGERRGRLHLWDRMTGRYRLEYPRGTDTTVVVLFNTETREGQAYVNGEAAQDSEDLVLSAYGAFINDTYWLLMPTKMMDPGVSRTLVPDSNSTDLEVVRLNFDNVGLTPGDAYYVYLDRQTGMVRRWNYVLESGREGRWDWEDFVERDGPQGVVRLSTRKAGPRVDLLTDQIVTPSTVPEGIFDDPRPRLPIEV
jgi:hypothetical protein